MTTTTGIERVGHPMFVKAFGREPERDERLCATCDPDLHDYDDHVIRGSRIPCSQCKCRDFACFEHPDGCPELAPW